MDLKSGNFGLTVALKGPISDIINLKSRTKITEDNWIYIMKFFCGNKKGLLFVFYPCYAINVEDFADRKEIKILLNWRFKLRNEN